MHGGVPYIEHPPPLRGGGCWFWGGGGGGMGGGGASPRAATARCSQAPAEGGAIQATVSAASGRYGAHAAPHLPHGKVCVVPARVLEQRKGEGGDARHASRDRGGHHVAVHEARLPVASWRHGPGRQAGRQSHTGAHRRAAAAQACWSWLQGVVAHRAKVSGHVRICLGVHWARGSVRALDTRECACTGHEGVCALRTGECACTGHEGVCVHCARGSVRALGTRECACTGHEGVCRARGSVRALGTRECACTGYEGVCTWAFPGGVRGWCAARLRKVCRERAKPHVARSAQTQGSLHPSTPPHSKTHPCIRSHRHRFPAASTHTHAAANTHTAHRVRLHRTDNGTPHAWAHVCGQQRAMAAIKPRPAG
jgi:hypothetical protein